MTPAQHALRYRIYCHCKPIGWNCTATDIADALGVSFGRVRGAVTAAGWAERLRGVSQQGPNRQSMGTDSEARMVAARYREPVLD